MDRTILLFNLMCAGKFSPPFLLTPCTMLSPVHIISVRAIKYYMYDIFGSGQSNGYNTDLRGPSSAPTRLFKS